MLLQWEKLGLNFDTSSLSSTQWKMDSRGPTKVHKLLREETITLACNLLYTGRGSALKDH